ncbi:hypothetical protein L3X38_005855 [Prunus dulcis]|uniref:Uncharacterized protein n=1 Tax=Prunus dulcis TaxID=3755 RepID=A0AAD4ZRK2_PRUDU|nr:hypothetical protein L3X38_005855 [Prunus dulcis]
MQPVQASATESKRFPRLHSTEPSSFYLRPPRSSPLCPAVYRPSQFSASPVSLVGHLRFCIDCSSPFSAIGTENSVRSETNRNRLEFANIGKEVQSREIKNPKSPISKIGYKTRKLQRNDNHLEEKIRKCEDLKREQQERAALASADPHAYVEKRKPVPDPQETGLIYGNKNRTRKPEE